MIKSKKDSQYMIDKRADERKSAVAEIIETLTKKEQDFLSNSNHHIALRICKLSYILFNWPFNLRPMGLLSEPLKEMRKYIELIS